MHCMYSSRWLKMKICIERTAIHSCQYSHSSCNFSLIKWKGGKDWGHATSNAQFHPSKLHIYARDKFSISQKAPSCFQHPVNISYPRSTTRRRQSRWRHDLLVLQNSDTLQLVARFAELPRNKLCAALNKDGMELNTRRPRHPTQTRQRQGFWRGLAFAFVIQQRPQKRFIFSSSAAWASFSV